MSDLDELNEANPRIVYKHKYYLGLAESLEFGVDFEICQCPEQTFYRPIRKESEQYLARVGYTGKYLLILLFDIPGITKVKIEPYGFTIEIGKAFIYHRIRSACIGAIKRTYKEYTVKK
jgi:hypothetical protein